MRFVQSTALLAFAMGIATVVSTGCRRGDASKTDAVQSDRPRVSKGIPWKSLQTTGASTGQPVRNEVVFVQVADLRGFKFTYRNGSSGKRLMSEATGGGCSWLDFDRDGQWDCFLVQGSADQEAPVGAVHDVLFRNQFGRFQNVSLNARLNEDRYGQGAAAGDFDNDGFDDLFVSNIGGNQLWRNQGDGTFVAWRCDDIEAWKGWSSSAAWGDIDRDGDLDLYVCNYVDFDPEHPIICRDTRGEQIQCQPKQVAPVPDHLYENLGDGTFVESAQRLGLTGEGNRALGVVIADLVGDDQPEIYVANDATANFLFVQSDRSVDSKPNSPGKLRYEDAAFRLGAALDSNGRAQASMGISSGDYDRNGQLDLYLTHFEGEWNTLYGNFGEAGFRDMTTELNGADITMPRVGFGTCWQDFDCDGNDEIFIANGHIDDLGRKQVLSMSPQLMTFRDGKMHEIGIRTGSYFQEVFVGRGCAECDFDNDGDFDLAVVHQNSPAELLENRSRRAHWLSLEFVGTRSNRRGIGTRVWLQQGDRKIMQELNGGGSYCSSRQSRLIFGLGDHPEHCTLQIRWPSGSIQTLNHVRVDQSLSVVEEGPEL